MNNTPQQYKHLSGNGIDYADIMRLGFKREQVNDDAWLNQHGYRYFIVYKDIGGFTLEWDIERRHVTIWHNHKKKIEVTDDIKIVELYIQILENIESNKQKVEDAIKDVCDGKIEEHTCKHCGCETEQPDSECYANPDRKLLYNFMKWVNTKGELNFTEESLNFFVDKYLKTS